MSSDPSSESAAPQAEMPLAVRGYDVDLGGHVSNIVYVRWLEDLRHAFCDAYYPVEEMMAQGFLPVLISTNIEYKVAIRFGQRVRGLIRFHALDGPRWSFDFEITANDRLAASARQVGLFTRLADARPIRPPRDFVEKMLPSVRPPQAG